MLKFAAAVLTRIDDTCRILGLRMILPTLGINTVVDVFVFLSSSLVGPCDTARKPRGTAVYNQVDLARQQDSFIHAACVETSSLSLSQGPSYTCTATVDISVPTLLCVEVFDFFFSGDLQKNGH